MRSVSLKRPEVSDRNLVLDAQEAFKVFVFFWPSKEDEIENIDFDVDKRKFAQSLLIVAIDGTYAVGYLKGLLEVFYRNPGASIKKLIKKISKKWVKHWWKHATRENLENAKVYESVRASIAYKYRHRLDEILDGRAASGEVNRKVVLRAPSVPKAVAWG